MGVYDQIKKAFQDVVAPEISALRGEITRLDEQIDGLRREMLAHFEAMDQKIEAVQRELTAKIDAGLQRLDEKIGAVHRELTDKVEVGLRALDDKIDSMRRELGSIRNEMASRFEGLDAKFTAEIRRLDARMDGLDREVKAAIEVRERVAILETKLASR
jgi:predicted  nucleic acid-binding Zn-ribbon protein